MLLNELIEIPQYSLAKESKQKIMFSLLKELTELHRLNCNPYQTVVDNLFGKNANASWTNMAEIPFIPVSAFKNMVLKSIPDDKVYKVLNSSGTTGQTVSQIFLDKETARLQSLSLSKILSHVLGNERLPMLIIDSKTIYANREHFSARGAGVLGISVFGKDHTYLLDENFLPQKDVLIDFFKKYQNQKIVIFGFTSLVWQHFICLAAELDVEIRFENAILIHSGGWKKMIDIAIDNDTFRKIVKDRLGIHNIYNYYGMVEQVGSVFLENEKGYLHCPNFSDIIIRNPIDFSIQPDGCEGLVQVLSVLPKSYPGHSLLTEDIGVIMGEDDPEIKWKGKYFKILGRAKKAELRGCSDTTK